MEFEYFYTSQAFGALDVDDIGNVTIEANNDKGEFYYLDIETKLGVTTIFQYGPICPDLQVLEKSVNCSFKRINYSDNQISVAITKFLNNPYANISQAKIVDKEALLNCINIVEYVRTSKEFDE